MDVHPEPDSRLSKLLKNVIPEHIIHLSISSGSNPGDNVIGKMLTVQLETFSGRKETIIIKGLLPYALQDPIFTKEEKLMARVMTVFKVFPVELGFYERIRPELEKHFPLSLSLPAPKYFYGMDDVENHGVDSVLVLEDLRPKGFRMADKIAGLTYAEFSLVLENIARFHAVSYVYLQKHQKKLLEQLRDDPNSLREVDPLAIHVFSRAAENDQEGHVNFTCQIYFGQINHAKDINAITGELHEKISKFESNPQQRIEKDSKQAAKDYFPVVIHGDLWVNNILFKYDEVDPAKPVDISFIDFQQCRYSSVFDELHYFIYTSTSAEFRKKHLKQGLDSYYDIFTKTLDTLGASCPAGFSREEFHQGYRKYLGAAFCYALVAIPFQVGVPPEPETSSEEKAPPTPAEINANDEKKEGIPQANAENEIISNEELKKFAGQLFEGMGVGLQAAARNSPVAIKRFTDLCLEMDALGVFDVGN